MTRRKLDIEQFQSGAMVVNRAGEEFAVSDVVAECLDLTPGQCLDVKTYAEIRRCEVIAWHVEIRLSGIRKSERRSRLPDS